MSHFKPRFKRCDDGGYVATYGKGKKKVEGRLFPDNGAWLILDDDSGSEYAKLRDAKEAWGKWAEQKYNAADTDSRPSTPPGPPPMPSLPGPPPMPRRDDGIPFTPGQAIASKPPDIVKTDVNPFHADPFDGDFFEKIDGDLVLTPLGACMEVFTWMEARLDRIKRADTYPWKSVADVLRRKYPDNPRFK